jgi:hypothetical protein
MKNTQTPKLSALQRTFEVVSAISVVLATTYLFINGATFSAVLIFVLGFFTRWAILDIAKQDREFNKQCENDQNFFNNI